MNIDSFDILLANYIDTIYLNEDKDLIMFDGESACFVFGTTGDCCAHLVFEDIEYPAKKPKSGWRIEKVEEIDEYGYRLKTYEGDIVVSCRRDDDAWGGYDTGVTLHSYKWKNAFEEEIKWTEFKEIKGSK